MKGLFKGVSIALGIVLVAYCAFLLESSGRNTVANENIISQWEIAWIDEDNLHLTEQDLDKIENWTSYSTSTPITAKRNEKATQWIKMKLPEVNFDSPAILFDKVYGHNILMMVNDQVIYESQRQYNYEINTILAPLKREFSGSYLYLGISSSNRIGVQDSVLIGEFSSLQIDYIKSNITDFILGSALIFIAIVMLFCLFLLNSETVSTWLALCAVILASGVIVITYSSFLYSLLGNFGDIYVTLFDLSLFLLLPSFTFFFEKIFGSGYYSIIKKFRKFQVYYSLFCFVAMIINNFSGYRYHNIYSYISATALGMIMIIQFIILVSTSTVYAIKGNREAIIFSSGFAIFAILGIGELAWFYLNSAYYDLFLWKWGVVSFLISLIIILGRRFAETHKQVVEYSRQLEMFNNELQRAEKMEIISEMAASVAHEVRNPLQVTRGFLQLIAEKEHNSDKVYMNMALDELDRASNIITDFLTFAKPEVGKVTTLNLLNEFIHIEGILVPMVNLQGGRISVHIPNDLYIRGNSSKFKQAFINIIKNSIEALHGDGDIQIWAHKENGKVSIHIKDNGEGMDKEALSRLGEPYFSTKTKGTGLGLMVTFRIIEVMEGEVHFTSEKGVGTEAIISFPQVNEPES
ncbi:sensor histidine kinase [Paenibacillus lentus]|uniref:histidine kinase n=1 Tax=Paenibacillus lentus TaxID=1338368 RepID=A0A3S8RTT1_9BACL|nr:HAMP domain-containing sensor histidine kinase [Paenibacillus lentus]AZK46342.1 sensor histidine kinase [Paenibacillus lentus]